MWSFLRSGGHFNGNIIRNKWTSDGKCLIAIILQFVNQLEEQIRGKKKIVRLARYCEMLRNVENAASDRGAAYAFSIASTTRQKATSYFDKSRGSLLITGAHCDIQPSGIQGFNIIDTQQRGQHPRLLKESLSIECRTLLLYPPPKRSKLSDVPTIFRKRWPSSGKKSFYAG